MHALVVPCLALAMAAAAALALPSSATAQVAIPFSTNVAFANTSQVATFVVDLGSLPLRPELFVQALPDNPNLQLSIELDQFQIVSPGDDYYCPQPGQSIASAPATGNAELVWKAWTCDPEIDALDGETLRVSVRVVSFGGASAPVNVRIAMRGVTSPPTGTQLVPFWPPGQHTITLTPIRDTTIYEKSPGGSNGAGQFLWVGRDVSPTPFAIRSVLSFPVRRGPIPQTASIDAVTLRLDVESIVGTGNALQLWSSTFNGDWEEGIADAAGNEFAAGTSAVTAADWNRRRRAPDRFWGDEFSPSPGGDPIDLLASQAVTTTGVKTVSSSALREYVENMLADGGSTVSFQDGFVLRGPEASAASSGVQIASRENASPGATGPELVVTFTVPGGPQESTTLTGAVPFIDEGQNLRWIYDLDQDDVYITPVSGICTTSPGDEFMPYSYEFAGTPGFTGVDCCTWHLDSDESGTVGTGQLLFFHNLDATNPANLPPDTDRDGIRDLCDNCPNKANGPLLGSCLTGPRIGSPCRSNPECNGGLCDLAQQDTDFDKTGDACVPEPGTVAMLLAGSTALAGVGARRDRWSRPAGGSR